MADVGKWVLDTSKDEGVDAYFQKTGLPTEAIQKIKNAESVSEGERTGNKYTVTLNTKGFPTKVASFELGKEFEMEVPWGVKYKVTITENGNTFTDHCVDPEGKVVVITREVNGNEMKATTKGAGGVMVRYWVRA